MDSLLVTLIPLMFLIFFPLFWCAIVFLISRFGWAQLADEFATDRGVPSDGEVSQFQSMRLGSLFLGRNYNNIVTIGVSEKGLFLGPSLFLFRVGHRDLLIPWSKIDRIEPGTFLWFATNTLEIRGGYSSMTIYRSTGHAVRERWEAETSRKARP